MASVGTSIIGRPRRLSRHRRAASSYTLICEEPLFSDGISLSSHRVRDEGPSHMITADAVWSSDLGVIDAEALSDSPNQDRQGLDFPVPFNDGRNANGHSSTC